MKTAPELSKYDKWMKNYANYIRHLAMVLFIFGILLFVFATGPMITVSGILFYSSFIVAALVLIFWYFSWDEPVFYADEDIARKIMDYIKNNQVTNIIYNDRPDQFEFDFTIGQESNDQETKWIGVQVDGRNIEGHKVWPLYINHNIQLSAPISLIQEIYKGIRTMHEAKLAKEAQDKTDEIRAKLQLAI